MKRASEGSIGEVSPKKAHISSPNTTTEVNSTIIQNSWTTLSDWINNPGHPVYERVSGFYKKNHSFQTVEFVTKQQEKYAKLNKKQYDLWDIITGMDDLIDESDPDLELSQIVHCFQTAESLRRKFPDEEKYDWLYLTGLIHDCGKILVHFGEPQWAVVGDTYPVGCKFCPSPKMDYPNFFHLNSDSANPKYTSKLGIYKEGCGLENVKMSWGHDEYLYRVLKGNTDVKLPPESLYLIRFHSFWYWHFGGEYSHLLNENDKKMLPYLEQFRVCDLYSKEATNLPDPQKLRPYYEKLMKKYLPEKLWF